MKRNILFIVLGVASLFLILYLTDQDDFTKEHPTLNEKAQYPDEFLKSVKHYAAQDRLEQSALNLGKAISFIWEIESDVDEKSFAKLQEAIRRLEMVHASLLEDSLDREQMSKSFEFALNNLARAELEVSEMYAETNQMDVANTALKFAQLHIKNAMLFHDHFFDVNEKQLAIEEHIFNEMDSLLASQSISPVEYSMKIDRMIKEVDQLLGIAKS